MAGIYPLIFPPAGYHGQLNWLGDTAACMGMEAYNVLLAASKEDKFELPTHVEVKHVTGNTVHLGPNLTTPTPSGIKRMPSLSVIIKVDKIVVRHEELVRQDKWNMEWELNIPEEEPKKEEEENKKNNKDEEEGWDMEDYLRERREDRDQ